MIAKEKALKLCQQFGLLTFSTKHNDGYTLPLEIAKQCAIIAVDEIILEMPMIIGEPNIKRLYWQEVKKEIEKL
jgi:hypothetical protein